MKQLSFKKERGALAADLTLLLCLFRINGQWVSRVFNHVSHSRQVHRQRPANPYG
ncbi:MAG: hypothetical protein LBR26_06295 [Prevotella sp.]|nr:hypothetical protein [Prevotella sp.]